jgi:hypothetical protein
MREPDLYIGGKDNPYLLRWYLIPRNRFFNVYLHKIVRSDDDRALHDHPWYWLSVMLRGRYAEVVKVNEHEVIGHIAGYQEGKRPQCTGYFRGLYYEVYRRTIYRAGAIRIRRATHTHRLELIDNKPCWTLFITGPKIREWGFHCLQGWRHWQIFTTGPNGEKVGRGCE